MDARRWVVEKGGRMEFGGDKLLLLSPISMSWETRFTDRFQPYPGTPDREPNNHAMPDNALHHFSISLYHIVST